MIGAAHRRRAKSPLGTVLIINLLGKGLTPRAFWEMEAPFDGLLVSIIHVVFVIDYFIRDQFTFLAKVNIRVKIFSVCSLHLMENSMFVKHVT